MNRKQIWLLATLTTLLLMTLLSACAFERNYLIGKWENAENKMVFDFTDTGQLRIITLESEVAIDYQFQNDKTLIIQNQQEVPFRINGNQLTLTLGAEELTFIRK